MPGWTESWPIVAGDRVNAAHYEDLALAWTERRDALEAVNGATGLADISAVPSAGDRVEVLGALGVGGPWAVSEVHEKTDSLSQFEWLKDETADPLVDGEYFLAEMVFDVTGKLEPLGHPLNGEGQSGRRLGTDWVLGMNECYEVLLLMDWVHNLVLDTAVKPVYVRF